MAIEAGAKKPGIIEPDEATLDYLKERAKRPYKNLQKVTQMLLMRRLIEIDVSKIEPQVAFLTYLKIPNPLARLVNIKN